MTTAIQLGTNSAYKIFFGSREADVIFLGSNLLYARNHIVYTAKDSSTLILDFIQAGSASNPATDILRAAGALT